MPKDTNLPDDLKHATKLIIQPTEGVIGKLVIDYHRGKEINKCLKGKNNKKYKAQFKKIETWRGQKIAKTQQI